MRGRGKEGGVHIEIVAKSGGAFGGDIGVLWGSPAVLLDVSFQGMNYPVD